ncbi:4-oxalocrotonate tautomerase [Anaerotruncus colihominis]|uniref:4-oxalocrotonate tautomerase n=1 Tax=Anaerotruncus colihominis TaxID=169435 RepID=A0A845RHX2_9FIRM|nr:4-oxalocrotonate tautomerase [Anaerotruncus colihominis]NBI79193.1 4-oxalocrotonate tautomerase [Anaerotruncus colihominis]
MGKLTANIPEELHQKVRDEVAADESLTTSMVVQRAMEAYYSKGGNKMNESTRTLAFQIPEGLFHRIQNYLAAQRQQAGKKLTQKAFILGLIEQALEEWEDTQDET